MTALSVQGGSGPIPPLEVPLEMSQVHIRRWFASSVDDVIVGKMSCTDIDTRELETEGTGNAR